MEFLMLILCVTPPIVTSITVLSNGNSPEVKMIGGMMVDVQKGFMPMTPKPNSDKIKKLNNDTKLSLNERYRRLIPYMTFYYANDIASTTEAYSHNNVEVEKAEIVEAQMIQRQPKKITYSPYRTIPRYHGNRLTQFNIASANPVKVYYNKESAPVLHYEKTSPNLNPLISDYVGGNQDFDQGRFVQKQIVKPPSVGFAPNTARKPYVNLHNNDGQGNIHYYLAEKDKPPKFKLVPYDQTPPLKVVAPPQIYDSKKPIPVPVLVSNDQVYIKPRPLRLHYNYDNVNFQQVNVRKIPAVVSENYYVKQSSPVTYQPLSEPIAEDGFKPIPNPVIQTEGPVITTAAPLPPRSYYEKYNHSPVQVVEVEEAHPEVTSYRPNYYQYVVDPPAPQTEEYNSQKSVTLSDLLNSLQLNKSIPKPITKENVGSSIRTLLQVLNALKAMSQNTVEAPILSTPKPFSSPVPDVPEITPKSVDVTPEPISDIDLNEEPYLAHVNTPSQHLDDIANIGVTSQQFPPPVNSDNEGGTPGRPDVDYPVLTAIPTTRFDCKTQRYKGFFADPETRCQVWHYCDLNGGQASFLCPNGTIFSQAALTCDWWFNVRCASTTQLYVLNESLYKYILPHSPKFPEDYSGPLVDKYLTLKFKEMEEQFRKNKKQKASEKSDSEEEDDSSEDSSDKETEDSTTNVEDSGNSEVSTVSEASVLVETPGTSGNVERLQE